MDTGDGSERIESGNPSAPSSLAAEGSDGGTPGSAVATSTGGATAAQQRPAGDGSTGPSPDAKDGEGSAESGSGVADGSGDGGAGGSDAAVRSSSVAAAAPAVPRAATTMYAVKFMKFGGVRRQVLLQDENGPCPLLAICNVLLLRGNLPAFYGVDSVTSDQLIESVGSLLYEVRPRGATTDDWETHIAEAYQVVPRLDNFLQVNIVFGDVDKFEYTREMDVFDLLGVALLHGWVVDASAEPETAVALRKPDGSGYMSYNQTQDVLATADVAASDTTSADSSQEAGSRLSVDHVRRFLERTSNQLTTYGLAQLRRRVRQGALAVLFYNNHFSVITQHNGELYMLATDVGLCRSEPVLAWQRIKSADGDCEFCSEDFKPVDVALAERAEKAIREAEDAEMARQLAVEEGARAGVAGPAPVSEPREAERSFDPARVAHPVVGEPLYVRREPVTTAQASAAGGGTVVQLPEGMAHHSSAAALHEVQSADWRPGLVVEGLERPVSDAELAAQLQAEESHAAARGGSGGDARRAAAPVEPRSVGQSKCTIM